MLKLFVYKKLPDRTDVCRFLTYITSQNEFEGKLFQKTATKPFKEIVELVSEVSEADYILLPHDYVFITSETDYLQSADAFAATGGKRLMVFAYGDSTEKVPLKHALVLRPCSYRSELAPNEIIVPPYIEDLGEQYEIKHRHKTDQLPVVGFAGMVALPTLEKELKYQIKIFVHRCLILLGLRNPAQLQGLYFRRKITRLLEKATTCKTNFVIRNTFSADATTVSKDPAVIRQEYVDVLQSCDLGLVIRGDGNYSLRFFEVLSLGLIPLFIDTDTALPLEDEIPYRDFMLWVEQKDIPRLPTLIKEWWDALTPADFLAMQDAARAVFETKLRTDVFYKALCERLAQEARGI